MWQHSAEACGLWRVQRQRTQRHRRTGRRDSYVDAGTVVDGVRVRRVVPCLLVGTQVWVSGGAPERATQRRWAAVHVPAHNARTLAHFVTTHSSSSSVDAVAGLPDVRIVDGTVRWLTYAYNRSWRRRSATPSPVTSPAPPRPSVTRPSARPADSE